jgi:hypothetical protein
MTGTSSFDRLRVELGLFLGPAVWTILMAGLRP